MITKERSQHIANLLWDWHLREPATTKQWLRKSLTKQWFDYITEDERVIATLIWEQLTKNQTSTPYKAIANVPDDAIATLKGWL